MKHPIQVRAVHRAAEITGGMTSLAAYLGVPSLWVAAWMEGTGEVPALAFLRIVELIVERHGARPGGAIPTSQTETFRFREAANS